MGQKVEVFQYNRQHAPPVIQRIYDIGGGYLGNQQRRAMNPKTLLCFALVLSGGLLGCSTTARQAAATVKSSPIQKAVETLPDLKTVLKSIESGVPELACVGFAEEEGSVFGYYAFASQRSLYVP